MPAVTVRYSHTYSIWVDPQFTERHRTWSRIQSRPGQATLRHSCKYRRLRAPAPTFQAFWDRVVTDLW